LIFSTGIDKLKKTFRPRSEKQAPQEMAARPEPGGPLHADLEERKEANAMGRERIKIDLLIHDLKVPIAVIEAGLTSLLRRPEKYGPVSEKQEKVFKRALRNTRVLQTLVSDALELGRAREGILNYSRFTLSGLLADALVEIFDLTYDDISEDIKACSELQDFKRLLADKGVYLNVDERLWCQEMCQDEAKVRQILRNLLNNALKYRRSKVELEVDKQGDAITFSVSDDGEGIPSAYHEKIFKCYFQMNSAETGTVRGHGLGLAGVLVLVEDLGGRMTLKSDQGQGARFVVDIPLKPC